MPRLTRLGNRGSYHDPFGMLLLIGTILVMQALWVAVTLAPACFWLLLFWSILAAASPGRAPSGRTVAVLLLIAGAGLAGRVYGGPAPNATEFLSYLTLGVYKP